MKSNRLSPDTTIATVAILAIGLRRRHIMMLALTATARISTIAIMRKKLAESWNSRPGCDCWIRATSNIAQSRTASVTAPRVSATVEDTHLARRVNREGLVTTYQDIWERV